MCSVQCFDAEHFMIVSNKSGKTFDFLLASLGVKIVISQAWEINLLKGLYALNLLLYLVSRKRMNRVENQRV